MDRLFFWGILLASSARCQTVPVEQGAAPSCPPQCHCEEDGIMLSVDCSELGLSEVPANLSPLTAYLDLSMNNISLLQPRALRPLRFLEELRLSGNQISRIPGEAFLGLYNLKILMLQNNQLSRIPAEALRDLPNLQSLRLDANLISVVPERSFEGLLSLRHLWLDDNALTEIPVRALNQLPALQAMTLALNHIWHIPDFAFQNLSSLVVLAVLGHWPNLIALCVGQMPNPFGGGIARVGACVGLSLTSVHLHNNRIQSLGANGFDGLHSLETLGFHNNNIKAIPENAFVGNPLLQTIHFYDNPIQFVGQSAFQYLPKLHTLSLNGATDIRDFPDLKGTTSLEVLTLTRAGIRFLPRGMCQQLPSLRILELSHNQIEELPSFHQCQRLEELDLSWNDIQFIHPEAFVTLRSLTKLDLTDNQLVTLPLDGLAGLTHLKLQGNPALSEPFTKESFPKMRDTFHQPRLFQALSNLALDTSRDEAATASLPNLCQGLPTLTGKNFFPASHLTLPSVNDLDSDDLQLDPEESKLHPTIQCTPSPGEHPGKPFEQIWDPLSFSKPPGSPTTFQGAHEKDQVVAEWSKCQADTRTVGPFKPCDHLFESWIIRLGVWAIVLVSVLCNGLVILAVFASPSYLSPVKFIIGSIAGANMLTGISCSMMALVDALTYGRFATYGARWETGAGCRVTGFLSVLASQSAIFLLTLAAVQCSISASCVRGYGKSPSLGKVKAAACCCLLLSSVAALLPLFSIGEYGASPLCLPYPIPDGKPATLGFTVALVMTNMLCFLTITGTYIRLYCSLLKGDLSAVWDCAMVKHVAWLIFTNCLLYCPVAFLTFSSTLSLFLITPEVIKSVLLVVLPLPACLNPLLYLLFNPHFREDFRLLRQKGQDKGSFPRSCGADDMEKSSYDSTQALVSFSDIDHLFETPDSLGVRPILDGYSFPSMALIPCQQRVGTRGKERGFSEHCPCLSDSEVLITPESRDPSSSSLRITFFPSPPTPPYTSHL
ncbi:Leucine-rich repeat-containing G-protein coupled receptor 6 [Willisornis vidua]|uniref:Leucine-rich repeat-containing G-protein coupled receptor 6 n=1 Tax=Willisornis vidua TaxID=1566151 RepID=A0ABQ9DTJ3_9PASS|nr:Leucine-rich repeat-containing G-protein coupled receptor 6 [Willisornis vidua]